MKPVELEIIMRDSTRQGMQSVTGNVEELSKRIAQQNALIQKLEGDLRSMQAAFEKASRSGDQTENIAMIAALRKEVSTLKGELSELEKAQKKTSSAPVVSPVAPSGLKEQIAEVKANIKYMEDYVKQYEKSMKGMAPGKEKAIMTQEVEGAKAALLGEKEALVQLEAQMGSTGQKQTMLRTQIMNLKQEMAGMTEGTEEYRAAMERLGQMQDQYSDISTQGRIFADDNKNIKATMDAVSGLSGAMTAGVGVASLFGMEEEKLAQIQTKLQAVMAITMGVQQVANTLNKDSYFTHIILGKAKKALTVTTEVENVSKSKSAVVTNILTAANTRLAVALGISTTAAMALAATLTLGLSVVITAAVIAWNKYSSAQAKAKKETEEFASAVAQTSASVVADFKRLSTEWSTLGNNLDKKKKFIDDNREAFKNLGVSIDDVTAAENLLNANKKAFIQSVMEKAKAAAAMDIAAEKYKVAIQKMMEAEAMPEPKRENKTITDIYGKTYQYQTGSNKKEEAKKTADALFKEGDDLINKSLAHTAKQNKELADADIKTTETINAGSVEAIESSIARKKEALKKLTNKVDYDVAMLDIKAEEKKLEAITGKKDKGDGKELLTAKVADADLKARQKIEAMKIAIMAEGAAKEKAEARARFDAELARIDQEEKERLEALKKAKKNGLPVSKEQVTAVTDQSGQQRKLASQVYVKEFFDVEKEYADKQKKDFDKLLEKYQDYTAQRVDIEKKYNTDIAKLQTERDAAQQKGDAEKVDQMNRAIAQATTNKGKELMGLDYEQLKQTPDYVRAFENLKETSSDTLDSLLSQLENAKQTAAEVLSPDQLREYTTTIQEIMDELDSRNPFGALADRKKELAEAEAELATAQQQLNAVQGGAKIVTGVKNTKLNDKTGKIDSEKTYLTTTKAMENYNKAQDNVTKKGAKVKKAEKEVKDVMDDLFNSIKDVGDAIGGPAGEIIGLIGDIGLFTMTAMSGVQTASKTATTAIEQVEKASAILTVIGAAIQIAMKIASLFKGESDEDKKKREIEHYNQIIAIYDKIIDKQKESIKFGFGFSSIEAAKKAMQELTKQTDQYRNIANRDSKEIIATKKDIAQIEEYVNLMKKMGIDVKVKDIVLFNTLDKEWKSFFSEVDTNQLSELSSKQLEYIRDNYKDLWASLTDEQRNALQAIIDAEEKGKEIIDEWKESITGVSYDSFYSEYIDMLSDMDMSAADMAENFGEHLRKSILAAMVAKNFQKDIDNLYEMWADAAGENSDSGMDITKDESNAIQQKYKELIEAMTTARDSMAKDFGWESSATSQSGKAGTFTTMTQDQGTKLEGLFTSVQGHVSNIDDTVKDIVMAMYEAFDVLLRIEANTAYCKHLEQMAEDIAELKRDGFKMK